MTAFPSVLLSGVPSASSPFGNTRLSSHDGELKKQSARLASAYECGLRAIGVSTTLLDAPSIYHSAQAHATIGVNATAIHVSVRPIPDIRPFHGVSNYAVFDGPISELDRGVPDSLRLPVEILSTLDAVLCTSSKLADELRLRGISRARLLPPPLLSGPTTPSHEPTPGTLDSRSPIILAALRGHSIRGVVRSDVGQIMYWDRDESSGNGSALEMILHAAQASDLRAARCALFIASKDDPFDVRQIAGAKSPFDRIYWVDSSSDENQKMTLVRECDFFIRAGVCSGIDLDVLAAVAGGALALVPEDHAAVELMDSGAIISFRPECAATVWGRRKAPQCLDLVRAMNSAIGLSVRERELRGREAAEWVASHYGLEMFADKVRGL